MIVLQVMLECLPMAAATIQRAAVKLQLVVCGSGRQFKQHVAKHNLDSYAAKWITDPADLRGYNPDRVEIVLVGDYWHSPVFDALEDFKATVTIRREDS